jgi:hypothetical protein
MQLTSKITQVEPIGTWSNGQRTFNKFRVSFANGDTLSFLAVKDFKANVGENLTYEKNPQYNTGKIIRDDSYEKSYNNTSKPADTQLQIVRDEPYEKTYEKTYEKSDKPADTQLQIVRQSMLKAAVEYHDGNRSKTEYEVIETARNFVNFITNG